MESLASIHAFVQAAEARSFTAAARQLGLSPSAVGKAVARLEERVGVRLLQRSTRTITLTSEGARFLERCRRILVELEAAEQELAETQDTPRGTLRVSMPLASTLMMPALSAFMRAHPTVALELDFSDRLVDVIEEGFEAVVRAGSARDSRLMSRVLGTFRLQLVASPAYLKRAGTPRRTAELARHACLQHRYATSGKLEPWPLRTAVTLPTTAVANTIEPLLHLAEQGHGIACLPDFALRAQLAAGTLVRVLPRQTQHQGTFRILWPSSRHLSPRLRLFIDFMATHLFRNATP
ncbi:MAG: LysR family transcriptional regulator [Polyangiales bacterium]